MIPPTDAVAAPCPVCEGVIEISLLQISTQVECPDCEELFMIASVQPLELVYALDMEEEGQFAEDERRDS